MEVKIDYLRHYEYMNKFLNFLAQISFNPLNSNFHDRNSKQKKNKLIRNEIQSQ